MGASLKKSNLRCLSLMCCQSVACVLLMRSYPSSSPPPYFLALSCSRCVLLRCPACQRMCSLARVCSHTRICSLCVVLRVVCEHVRERFFYLTRICSLSVVLRVVCARTIAYSIQSFHASVYVIGFWVLGSGFRVEVIGWHGIGLVVAQTYTCVRASVCVKVSRRQFDKLWSPSNDEDDNRFPDDGDFNLFPSS